MKKSLLFCVFFLALLGCERDKTIEFQPAEIQQFQSKFTLENFNNVFVKKNLVVEWNNYSIKRNSTNEIIAYEFNTHFKAKSVITSYIEYKLIASKSTENHWNLEMVRFSCDKAYTNLNTSYFSIGNFTGSLYHYNLKGQNTSIKVYQKGNIVKTLALSLEEATSAKAPPIGGGWIRISILHYTDWYTNKGGGGTLTYSHSTYNGTSSEWVYVPPSDNYHGMPYDKGDEAYHNHYPHGGGAGNNHENENVVEEEIIDVSELDNPCIEGIIKKLQTKNSYDLLTPDIKEADHLSKMILDLFDHSSKYTLYFKTQELGLNNQGYERNATTIPFMNGWRIKLDTDLVNDATQLFLAKTIIHESMHAYIGYILKENKTSDMASDLQSLYAKFIKTYHDEGVANNLTQHEFVGQYVETLAYSLAAYDNYKYPMTYYKKLSWGGLETSSAYKHHLINQPYKQPYTMKDSIKKMPKAPLVAISFLLLFTTLFSTKAQAQMTDEEYAVINDIYYNANLYHRTLFHKGWARYFGGDLESIFARVGIPTWITDEELRQKLDEVTLSAIYSKIIMLKPLKIDSQKLKPTIHLMCHFDTKKVLRKGVIRISKPIIIDGKIAVVKQESLYEAPIFILEKKEGKWKVIYTFYDWLIIID